MAPDGDHEATTRRALLATAAGAFGASTMGSVRAAGTEHTDRTRRCTESTLRASTVPYDEAHAGTCSDDHPDTRALQRAVRGAFEREYPTLGALLADGFIPYFDFLTTSSESGVSHWLQPDYLGDGGILSPERPESVLVDHVSWRPIGAMFVATRDGDRVADPPSVYVDEERDHECRPWHAHVGVPGRYAWWKYRLLYVDGVRNVSRRLPCRTPWMMHVWAYGHPESVYAHAAPPRDERGVAPATRAGFDTDAVPGEDELDWEMLPEAVKRRAVHR